MDHELSNFVGTAARKLNIPGIAVGVWNNGKDHYACHGVTSIDNPLPITPQTLFVLGSITKTYTATAIMRLVSDGKINLEAPVQRYIPELQLSSTAATSSITLLQLLNHTSGLDWGVTLDTGEGDDALEKYVSLLSTLRLLDKPGSRFSYSQAGYNVLGRVIEKVTGKTYENAIADILLFPIGLKNSFFDRDDIMTRRFSVGHNSNENGDLTIARLWRRWRGENPGGGLVSSVEDQLSWVCSHMGKQSLKNNAKDMLPDAIINQMQSATVELRASNLGDAVGIGWFLRKIDGVLTAGHAGSANGQFGEILFVPERDFAVVTLANAGPNGLLFNQEVIKWALKHYIDLTEKEVRPASFDAKLANEITGHYENEVMTLDVITKEEKLQLEVLMKKEIRASANKELPPDHEPFYFGMLSDTQDEYIITSGAFNGQRGYFTRDPNNNVIGINLAGRLFSRVDLK